MKKIKTKFNFSVRILALFIVAFLTFWLIPSNLVFADEADTTPPTITLIGDNPVTIDVGSTYEDAGATAIDDVDGDLTGSIVVANNVNTSVADSYTVTYNVSDSAGNAAVEVVRTVNVVELIYHNTLGIEIGEWTTDEEGESGRQTYFSVGSDCIGRQYRLIISGTGNIFPSSFGDTTGFITDTTWYHVTNFSVILEPGEYTATLYIGDDLNNDYVLDPGEAFFEYSEGFTITTEQPDGSGTLDVSPGISGGNTTVSIHGINSQGMNILLWIFKFDGTLEQLIEIGDNSDGNEVFQYLVYGTIPDFEGEVPDVSQLEGFFTIDSNDWYKDVNVILQQGNYFAIVFPIVENSGPDDFLIKEFSVNDGIYVPVSNPILSTDKADYSPGETVPIAGTGFLPNAAYTIVVTRPDGSIVMGDGSYRTGSDIISADNNGNFTYYYKLDGIEGKYLVRAVDSAGNTVAETDFTDSERIAASENPIPGIGSPVQELAFTGIDPTIPISGAAAAIIGLILIIIPLRNKQQRNWKHALGYCDREDS